VAALSTVTANKLLKINNKKTSNNYSKEHVQWQETTVDLGAVGTNPKVQIVG